MHHIHAELDPETGAKVITAIRATVTSLKHHEQPAASAPEPVDPDAPLSERIAATVAHIESNLRNAATYDELMVQAFVELITGARAVDRRIPEICTLIDLHTLIDGLTSASICETSAGELLPPGTIRRLACDGNIIPIVLGGRSEVLDVGRSQRLATPAQRQALRAMYSTCVIPGCDVPFDRCEIHHVKPWAHDLGATDLADLAPVCGHDHHRLHEGGWRLDLAHDPERTVTLRRPDGTVEFEGPSIQRRTTRAA